MTVLPDRIDAPLWVRHLDAQAMRYLLGYLVAYTVFGILTVGFYPSFSWPYGDEGTYLDYARQPWTLTSEFFEGFRPKEVQNPYNARLFLNPFSALFAVFGFTVAGARLLCFAYGLGILYLVFRLGSAAGADRPGHRAAALFATIVLSWQPQFLFFTHGIRPEILFSLFLLLCTWILVRRPDGPTPRTYLALGFASSSMLLVHYNGVTCQVLFFLAACIHDRGRRSLRKVGAFAAGGTAFVVIFMLVNFLPALDTVREFGVMPVTFVSKSELPIATLDLWTPILTAALSYMSYWQGVFSEPATAWFSTALLLPALLGLAHGHRTTWTIGAVAVLIVTFLVYLIPNRRAEYAFYLCPFVFPLAAAGVCRTGTILRIAGITVLTVALGAYVWSDTRELQRFAGYRAGNAQTTSALQEIAQRRGADRAVRVLATQEFRAALPRARYRTFHSMITTKSLAKTLELLDPDIVVIHERAMIWLAVYSTAYDHLPQNRFPVVERDLRQQLAKRGLAQLRANLTWDGKPILVFARR